ncbi:hypothetical protein [Pseudomonas baltica]|uniref:hypothetical protein n=1 Tax=Pseudomonas baltica TaxID=2762576 RepID=UPI00289C72E0|nr:hypothetical protein [Pseudomonas baltica]
MLKMTVEKAQKIADIAAKPGCSASTHFILIQHVTRNLLRHRKEIFSERRAFHRQAAKLKPYLPFARKAIDELNARGDGHRAQELEGNDHVLTGIGHMLMRDREGAYEALGFEKLCDLLSINPVHRAEARLRQEERSLAGLIYVSRLENSVSPRLDNWGDGGPLFEACFATLVEWLKTAPKEDLPDLFGPGSPFDGVRLVEVKAETLQ